MKERLKKIYSVCKGRLSVGGKVFCRFLKRVEFPLLFLTVTVLATLLRGTMFQSRSGDYNVFLAKWFDRIKTEGIVKSLGQEIGDYTPAYFYILSLLTLLPVSSLYSIKAVSCAFDVLLAAYVCLCVRMLTGDKIKGFLAYCATLFLPTVFLNSGSWAQCDSIYAAFCVMSVYYLIREKKLTALILYGVAFSFKLQAIFLAPLFAVLYFRKKIPVWSPLVVVGVYFLFCVPSWLCGRNLSSLLTVYFHQAGEYQSLTLNAPTLAALFGNVSAYHVNKLSYALIWLCLAATLLFVWLFVKRLPKEGGTGGSLVKIGLLFALTVPFLLPRMHERYFYLADVLAVAYGFLYPKRIYTAVLTEFCSFWAVGNYLFGMNYLSLGLVALIQLINVLLLCKDLAKAEGNGVTALSILTKMEEKKNVVKDDGGEE